MNFGTFYGWLKRLDAYFGLKPGRKVSSLVENFGARGKEESMPTLQNVCVSFLPPNTTSCVQLIDAGIITWVKCCYKHRLLLRISENLEVLEKSIYYVDVLTAIRLAEIE